MSNVVGGGWSHFGKSIQCIGFLKIDNNDSDVAIANQVVQALIQFLFRLEYQCGINGFTIMEVFISSLNVKNELKVFVGLLLPKILP